MFKHRLRMVTRIVFPLVFTVGYSFRVVAQDRTELVSAADLLRYASIGEPGTLDWDDTSAFDSIQPPPAIFSPDGLKVAVVVRGGDPQREANVSAILVYDTSALLSHPAPLKVAEIASLTADQPIAFVRWLGDSQTLVFAGSQGRDLPQVYRVSLGDHKVEAMTRARDRLNWFDVSASGDQLIMVTETAAVPLPEQSQCKLQGCRITQESLYAWKSGNEEVRSVTHMLNLRTGSENLIDRVEDTDASLRSCNLEIRTGISPDGRYAIQLCTVKAEALPKWWGAYTMDPAQQLCMKVGNERCFRRGFLTDLQTGRSIPWTTAPLEHPAYQAAPIWVDGGKSVILPATLESLEDVDSSEKMKRLQQFSVLLMNTQTHEVTRIGRINPLVASFTWAKWDASLQMLTVGGEDKAGATVAPAYYQRRQGQWVELGVPPKHEERGSDITVKESANDRPVLMGLEPRTGRQELLLDPNPWLAQRTIGRVEVISWKARTGRIWRGSLYYPPHYVSGERYPIVLQTHGFIENRYQLYGFARSYPGQALSSHGLFVLQMNDDDHNALGEDRVYSTDYWDLNRAGYEGAIDELDRRGLIDRNKVGTIGFSNSGATTGSLLTHSEYPVAAAVFGDTAEFGLWVNTLQGGTLKPHTKFGSKPFGAGIAPWLELSPTSNLDRVRTPLLMFVAESPDGVWDWYAGLRSLQKPVELWDLPTGTHDVYQASQRLRMNQLVVDWFCFWLKGEERTVPGAFHGDTIASLAEQYGRWHELRILHELDMKTPRPQLLKWTATPVAKNKVQ